MRSIVLIWDADSSSTVAVCRVQREREREMVIDRRSTSTGLWEQGSEWKTTSPHWRTWWGKWSPWWTLFCWKREKDGEVREDTGMVLQAQWGPQEEQKNETERDKDWLTEIPGLSSGWCWAELSCRHEWEPPWSKTKQQKTKETSQKQPGNLFFPGILTFWEKCSWMIQFTPQLLWEFNWLNIEEYRGGLRWQGAIISVYFVVITVIAVLFSMYR